MNMKRMRFLGLTAISLIFLAGVWPAFADPKSVTGENEVLPYLEQVIAWQRETATLEPALGSARESLLKTSLGKASGDVLKYSFAFARTQAQLIDKTAPDAGGDQDGDKDKVTGGIGKGGAARRRSANAKRGVGGSDQGSASQPTAAAASPTGRGDRTVETGERAAGSDRQSAGRVQFDGQQRQYRPLPARSTAWPTP